MEFQFGTNWSRFSQLTGGVIAQPLAMEGVFSFFLESAFLGLLLFGEKRLGRIGHWWAGFHGVLRHRGSRVSSSWSPTPGCSIPSPTTACADGSFEVASFWGVLGNPWGLIQYAHVMSGALTTGAFAMAAAGAFYLLSNRATDYGRIFVRVGVIAGVIATVVQIFPTGDLHGRYMASHQPVTTAGMEALFHTQAGAPIVIFGQPDVERQTHRQSARGQPRTQFSHLWNHRGRGEGSQRFSNRRLAHQRSAPVFRLPRHGGPGDDLRRDHGSSRLFCSGAAFYSA